MNGQLKIEIDGTPAAEVAANAIKQGWARLPGQIATKKSEPEPAVLVEPMKPAAAPVLEIKTLAQLT